MYLYLFIYYRSIYEIKLENQDIFLCSIVTGNRSAFKIRPYMADNLLYHSIYNACPQTAIGQFYNCAIAQQIEAATQRDADSTRIDSTRHSKWFFRSAVKARQGAAAPGGQGC